MPFHGLSPSRRVSMSMAKATKCKPAGVVESRSQSRANRRQRAVYAKDRSTTHPIQKTINQIISKVRVTVEHAIAGIKRCHIVADTFRNRRQGFVDKVILVVSGLHNLRVATAPSESRLKETNTPFKHYDL